LAKRSTQKGIHATLGGMFYANPKKNWI